MVKWPSPQKRGVLTAAEVCRTQLAVLWAAPWHNSAWSLLCVRVAISLPEIVHDEKITPLHPTSLVILHPNCRTTTSKQTEPQLQATNTGLKTPNTTDDDIQDPSSHCFSWTPEAERSMQAKSSLFFQQPPMPLVWQDYILLHRDGSRRRGHLESSLLKAAYWGEAPGHASQTGASRNEESRFQWYLARKSLKTAQTQSTTSLWHINIRRGEMVSGINHHRMTQVSSVVGGESNFINNST